MSDGIQAGGNVEIRSWRVPGEWRDGRIVDVAITEDHRGTVVERDDGTAHWEVTTVPVDAGCGGTSHTLLAEGDAATLALARGAVDGALASLDMLALDRCAECGGEGFARFSVRVQTAGPRPAWLPNNDRATTVCRACAHKAAGVSGEIKKADASTAEPEAGEVATVTPITDAEDPNGRD